MMEGMAVAVMVASMEARTITSMHAKVTSLRDRLGWAREADLTEAGARVEVDVIKTPREQLGAELDAEELGDDREDGGERESRRRRLWGQAIAGIRGWVRRGRH